MTEDARQLARLVLAAHGARGSRQRVCLMPLVTSRTGISRIDLKGRLRARRIEWSLERVTDALTELRGAGVVDLGSAGWGVVSWAQLETVT